MLCHFFVHVQCTVCTIFVHVQCTICTNSTKNSSAIFSKSKCTNFGSLSTGWAMRDFLMALKATQARRNKKRKVEFAFRSRKANSQSLSVPKKHWGHLRGAYVDVCLVAASCVAISHSQPRCNRTHAWCVHVWATTTIVCPSLWTFGARAKPLQSRSTQPSRR